MSASNFDIFNLCLLITIVLCWMEIKAGTLLLRTVDNYAVFPPFIPCPRSTLSFEFHTFQPKGLLLYSEDNSTGQFLSITLLPKHRLKVELELRLPQYRTSRDHATLMLDFSGRHRGELNQNEPKIWHRFNLTMASEHISNIVSGVVICLDNNKIVHHFTPGIIYSSLLPHSKPKVYFGEPLYIGQLPDHMRSDATKRSLFSAAMQSTYNGMIRNMHLGYCSSQQSQEYSPNILSEKCDQIAPILLNNGALFISNNIALQLKNEHCHPGKYIKPTDYTKMDKHSTVITEHVQQRCKQCHECNSDTLNLDGSSWANFILNTNQTNDQFSVQFRTRDTDQLLFYTVLNNSPNADQAIGIQAFMAIYISNGSLFVTVDRYVQNGIPSFQTMSITRQMDCVSDYGTCADTQWHQFTQILSKNTVLLAVDGQTQIKQSLPYSAGQLSVQEIYMAKRPTSSEFLALGTSLNLPRRPFRGCFRHLIVRFPGMELSMLAAKHTKLVTVQLSKTTHIRQECDRVFLAPQFTSSSTGWSAQGQRSTFVTFSKPGGYLRTPGWHIVSSAELSFKMRTTEPDGLLLYGSSVNDYELLEVDDVMNRTPVIPGSGKAGFDIIALELRAGRLVGSVNTGSGLVRLESSSSRTTQVATTILTDGRIHVVKLRFHEGNVLITVDDKIYLSHVVERSSYKYLNLNGLFYIGGVPNSIRHVGSTISPEVWSIRLHKDFVGCIGDLIVDDRLWDIDLEMRACWAEGFVHLHCYPPSTYDWCVSEGCKNGGVCSVGWNRYTCDCGTTNFGGDQCSEAPLILGFNGHQWLQIQFGPFPIRSLSEELLIRFRTHQNQGLLFTTYSPASAANDCLEVRIESGQLLVIYDFGTDRKKYKTKQFVADYRWHTLRLLRRDQFLNISVDSLFQLYDIPKDGRFLSHKHVILGRKEPLAYQNAIETFPLDTPHNRDRNTFRSVFIGHIMKFTFNGVDFLHVAKQLLNMPEYSLWKRRLEITATEGLQQPFMEYPVSFDSHESYIAIDIPDGKVKFSLRFWVKTDKDHGTLLVYAVKGIALFALEIVGDHLEAILRNNEKMERFDLPSLKSLTDAKWHQIQITRTLFIPDALSIKTDGVQVTVNISIPMPTKDQSIFLGGFPTPNVQEAKDDYNIFTLKSEFSGCVASITLEFSSNKVYKTLSSNSISQKLTSQAEAEDLQPGDLSTLSRWNKVKAGCNVISNEVRHRYDGHCTPRICHFDGRCVQQLGATRCDCSMTSLTGKYCTEVGPTIYLSSSPLGILKFELSPSQNTTRDQLAFGIQATRRGSRSLITINGQGASTDFLRISIIALKARHVLLVRYNMGGGQQTLLENNVDIADGRYHIVQLVRDGANSMLRVDLEHKKVNLPNGTQGTHFNDIRYIHVGLPLTPRHTKSSLLRNQSLSEKDPGFEGYVTGLNFNGIDLFQVVNGLIIPGIFLSEIYGIEMKTGFQPNMEHLREAQQRPVATIPLTANDMQVHSRQSGSIDYRSKPLIVPRVDCLQPEGNYDAKTCRPSEEDGLIKPFIEFGRPATSNKAPKKTAETNHWNADQSRHKQPQPNDFGLLNPTSSAKLYDTDSFDFAQSKSPSIRENNVQNNKVDQVVFPDPSADNQQKSDIFGIMHNRLKPNFSPKTPYVFNIGLIASVSAGGICVLVIITCIIYRCMRRDEGSYNVEESMAYTGEPVRNQALPGKRPSNDHQMSSMLALKHLNKSTDEIQSQHPTGKTALIVAFSDTCKATTSTSNSPNSVVAPKHEAPTSPSVASIESEKRKSDLIKIEAPRERTCASTNKYKAGKKMTDSQEWYV